MKLKDIEEFHYDELHQHDKNLNLGYHYSRNILKNVVSPEMFVNPANDTPFRQIERMVEFLVNQVKRIKLEYNFTLPKNSNNLN